MDRMTNALQYLAGEIVVTRDQALKDLHPADMLLDGMVSQGYARRASDDGRYLLTEAGHRKVRATETEDEG